MNINKISLIPCIALFTLFLFSCSNQNAIPSIDYAEESVPTPIPFANGVISTEENSEFEIAFSADGLTAYFSRRAPNQKQKIYTTQFESGTWSKPQIAEFSSDRDETVFITPNGQYLFFGSERPVPGMPNKGNFDMNVWMMSKKGDSWGEPHVIPEPINFVQEENEEWPSSNNNFMFSLDGEKFYFTTMMRGTNSIKLYETEFDGQTFTEPVAIDGFFDDEKLAVYSAVISPDGEYLVFNSYGVPNTAGGEDLFVSKRTELGWSKAKSMGSLINTKDEESSPRFSRDGRYFFLAEQKI